MLMRCAGYLFEEQLGGGDAELVLGLAYRAERGRQHGGEHYVVVADDGHLFGNADSSCGEPPEYPKSEKVVGAHHRARAGLGGEERCHRTLALVDGESAHDNFLERCAAVTASPLDRPASAFLPVDALPDRRRAVNQCDRLVPQLEEMVCGKFGASDVVYRRGAQPVAAAVPVQQHRRDAASHQCHGALQVAVDRANEKAVDTMLLEHAEVAVLAVGRLVGRAEHQDVVLITQHVLGAADYFGEERVRNVEEDHPDRAALAHSQLVCCGVAHEPCRVDRIENPPASGRRHDRRVVEHVRHRADGHLRKPGDLADGDPTLGRGAIGARGARATPLRWSHPVHRGPSSGLVGR